jgi:hypothetical protein
MPSYIICLPRRSDFKVIAAIAIIEASATDKDANEGSVYG